MMVIIRAVMVAQMIANKLNLVSNVIVKLYPLLASRFVVMELRLW